MAFCWWADDGLYIVISLPSSIKKHTKKHCQSWTPSDKISGSTHACHKHASIFSFSLILCILGNLHAFLLSADFFRIQNQHNKKFFQQLSSDCHRVWIQIWDPVFCPLKSGQGLFQAGGLSTVPKCLFPLCLLCQIWDSVLCPLKPGQSLFQAGGLPRSHLILGKCSLFSKNLLWFSNTRIKPVWDGVWGL